jgi:signal transduction histidine kinase
MFAAPGPASLAGVERRPPPEGPPAAFAGVPRARVEIIEATRATDAGGALATAAVEISRARSLEQLAAAVAHHARILVGADLCAVDLYRPGENRVELTAVSASRRHAALVSRPGWRAGGSGVDAHHPLRGRLTVPLVGHDGDTLGAIQLSDRHGAVGSDGDAATIVPVAQIAAVAVERQRREEEAERSRTDLAEAQRIAHLGSWIYTVGSGRLIWSDEVFRILGLSRESFPATYAAFLGQVHPADRHRLEKHVAATIAGESRFAIEIRMVRPGGEVRTVISRAELEQDGQGRPARLIGTVLDITRRRRAEDAVGDQAKRIALLATERRRLIAESLDAEERTRQRIAEVLHDGVLQDLLAARQDVMECVANDDDAAVARLLGRADAGIDEAIAGLRTAVGELHPLTLTHGGLPIALEAVGLVVSRRAGFRLTATLDPWATGTHDRLLLALGREFLVNAERHAHAGNVALRLERLHGVVRLSVQDDGVGFDPSGEMGRFRVGHIGLASARERVEVLGGQLSVTSRIGRGTRVAVVVSSPSAPPGPG